MPPRPLALRCWHRQNAMTPSKRRTARDFVRWKPLKELIQLANRRNKGLSSTAIAKWFLYADRTADQHTCRRNACIAGTEDAVAWQHHLAHSLRGHGGPPLGPIGATGDKSVCDGVFTKG